MKKITLLIVFSSLLFSFGGFAGTADLFSYDEGKIKSELTVVNTLENYLLQNEEVTYTDLMAGNNPFASVLNFGSEGFMGFSSFEPPLGIPSFLWGFCFGPMGMLVVYLVSEDSDETMKSLWGCVAGTVIGTVIYFAAFATVASTTP